MQLVLLSTSGNQRYIFASNRLREAVGGSELVRASTTDWVREAAGKVSAGGAAVTVLQESSGSALVSVDGADAGQEAARRLTRLVTVRALREAPGLDVTGARVPMAGPVPSKDDVQAVFAAARRTQARRASAAARFPRLPMVASCASTDLPAAAWWSDAPADAAGHPPPGEEPRPLSAEVIAKRRARPAAARRMRRLTGRRLVDIDRFFDQVEWVAVVHVDGNRLGEFFQRAPSILDSATETGELSRDVQKVADTAFGQAAEALGQAVGARPGGSASRHLPLVPLIVGGDDLTVLLDGARALEFVRAYLKAFGERSAHYSRIVKVRRAVWDVPWLTAAAGVAVVKPHFPFSAAYELAEQLCGQAKTATEEPGAARRRRARAPGQRRGAAVDAAVALPGRRTRRNGGPARAAVRA